MKRELLCPKCNTKTEVECARLAAEDGEGFDFRAGIMMKSGLVCDQCMANLDKGALGVCRTYAQRGERLRTDWANDYLRDFTPDEAMKFGLEINRGAV